LLLRLGYLIETSGTPLWEWHLWSDTDMDTFIRVAHRILDGDVVLREPPHPFHIWHREIAPVERWQGWYLPHVFYQVPGYYYFLAFLLKLFSGSLTAVKTTQVVIGAAHAALLGAVAKTMIGPTGGLIVGLLAAIYGPFIATEAMLLREGMGIFLSTASVYLVLRALRHPAPFSPQGGRSWVTAGVVLGLGALMKETGFVLFAAVGAWMIARKWRSPNVTSWRAVLFLCAGFTLVLSPLICRNLVVGAPPLAFNSNFPMTFAIANAADASSGGVFFLTPPSFASIMDQARGRMVPVVVATLRTYGDRPGLFLENLWAKFSAIWSNAELPDNFSYEYLTGHSALLSLLPRFVCIWLLGVVGFIMLLAQRTPQTAGPDSRSGILGRQPLSGAVPFPSPLFGLIVTILTLHVIAQSMMPVMSRYRLVIVPYLMLPAGWVLAQGLTWVMQRQWRACAGLGVAGAAVWLLWLAWPENPALQSAGVRYIDFEVAADILAKRGDFSGAMKELNRGVAYFQSHGAVDQELLLRRGRLDLFTRHRRFSEVQDDWELLSRVIPNDPVINKVRRRLSQERSVVPDRNAGGEASAPSN
jgi:hypothetical protein